jgi:hypothetical protein
MWFSGIALARPWVPSLALSKKQKKSIVNTQQFATEHKFRNAFESWEETRN